MIVSCSKRGHIYTVTSTIQALGPMSRSLPIIPSGNLICLDLSSWSNVKHRLKVAEVKCNFGLAGKPALYYSFLFLHKTLLDIYLFWGADPLNKRDQIRCLYKSIQIIIEVIFWDYSKKFPPCLLFRCWPVSFGMLRQKPTNETKFIMSPNIHPSVLGFQTLEDTNFDGQIWGDDVILTPRNCGSGDRRSKVEV